MADSFDAEVDPTGSAMLLLMRSKLTGSCFCGRLWALLSVTLQDTLAATLVNDAPHLLHGWQGRGPSLGELLHGEAPTVSRLPLR